MHAPEDWDERPERKLTPAAGSAGSDGGTHRDQTQRADGGPGTGGHTQRDQPQRDQPHRADGGGPGSGGIHRLDGPGPDGCTLRVDGPLGVKSLSRIRHAIADQAAQWHLAEPVVETVQTVVSELAANIVVHAGGDGSLILTHRPGVLYCQAVDHGPGMPLPALAGWRVPESGDPAAARGLWTVRMLSTRMHIDSSSLGTTVTTVLAWK